MKLLLGFQAMFHSLKVFVIQNQSRPSLNWRGVINRCETRILQCGAHPPCRARSLMRPVGEMPEAVELGAGFDTDSHQLRFIHHPQTIVVQQAEMHGPAIATHAVATVESSAEEHVLSAYEDSVVLRMEIPVPCYWVQFFAAHEGDHFR